MKRIGCDWGGGGSSQFHTEKTADNSREKNGFKI